MITSHGLNRPPIIFCLLVMLIFGIKNATSVSHERNLVWAQKDEQYTGVSRIVGASGDPNLWVTNRTASTKYITAPNSRWHFVAVGFDYGRQILYWTDAGNKKIQGLLLDGSNTAFTVYEGTSSKVEGLAVDWLAGNIYWCDAMYNWIAMAPSTRESGHYKIIISTGLDNPTGLATYPQRGLLFWSESGAIPRLERSTLDGRERSVLVERDLVQPMGITIDPEEERVYWVDRVKGSIESVDLYGGGRRKLFEVLGTQFFGIALYEDFVFVPDQEGRQLYVFNRAAHEHEVNFNLGSAVPYGIVMYDQKSQPKVQAGCDSLSCEQLCITDYSGRASCDCGEGYQLLTDGLSCAASGKFVSPQFIYSIGNALCSFPGNLADMNLRNVSLDTQCFLTDRKETTSLTFNFHENMVYFAENATKTISRTRLVSGDVPEVLLGGTGSVDGLALDWISNNLYWTDSEYRHVMVAKLDGRHQAVFMQDMVDQPRGIVVDAINRYVYWSDVGRQPRIERCGLDGSDRQTIVSKQIGSPNHLVVDYITQRLYWTDSDKDSIEWISLDGRERKVVAHPGRDLYGIAVFQDYLVWTDQESRNGLHVGRKDTGEKLRGIVHPGIGHANDVISFAASQQPLAEGPCDITEECQQLCLPSRDPFHATCRCAIGFVLSPDGRSCDADAFYDNFLLFTDTYQKQIYQMSLLTGEFHAVPLSGHDNPIALDFDPVQRQIYWTDVAAKVIKRSNVNGSDEEIIRILHDDSVPDGIAIDPLSRLLYYTDAGGKKIVAMDINGQHQATLVSTNVEHPRAIVLDPVRGMMYWTDWGLHSRIEKAHMDGSNRRKLVDTGVGSWPNGLAIDVKSKRIFWCDARSDRIETTDFEGEDRKVLFQEPQAHFFGIVSLDSMLYYTDWTKKTIMRLEWHGDTVISSTIGPAVFARANDIHAYKRDQLQAGLNMNACSFRNGGCSHLCIPVPSGRRCACPDAMFVSVTGQKCSNSPLYSTNDESSRNTDSSYSFTEAPEPPDVEKTSAPDLPITRNTPPTPTHYSPPLDNTGYPTPPPLPATVPRRIRPFRRRKTTVQMVEQQPTTTTKTTSTTSLWDTAEHNDEYNNNRDVDGKDRAGIDRAFPRISNTQTTRKSFNEPPDTPPSSKVDTSDRSDTSGRSTERTIEFLWTPTPKPLPKYPKLPPPTSTKSTEEVEETWWRRKTTQDPPRAVHPPDYPSFIPGDGGQATPRPYGPDISGPSNSSVSFFDGDSSSTMYGFIGLVAGGVVVFCVIVVFAVLLYKKCDVSSSSKRPPVPPPTPSLPLPAPPSPTSDFPDPSTLPPPPWSVAPDTYEMPVKDTSVSATRARYGRMGDGYYTGEVDSGIENPGYVNRESLTSASSYDGGGGGGGTAGGSTTAPHQHHHPQHHHSQHPQTPSFSTFRTTSTYSLDSINSFDSFD